MFSIVLFFFFFFFSELFPMYVQLLSKKYKKNEENKTYDIGHFLPILFAPLFLFPFNCATAYFFQQQK